VPDVYREIFPRACERIVSAASRELETGPDIVPSTAMAPAAPILRAPARGWALAGTACHQRTAARQSSGAHDEQEVASFIGNMSAFRQGIFTARGLLP